VAHVLEETHNVWHCSMAISVKMRADSSGSRAHQPAAPASAVGATMSAAGSSGEANLRSISVNAALRRYSNSCPFFSHGRLFPASATRANFEAQSRGRPRNKNQQRNSGLHRLNVFSKNFQRGNSASIFLRE